MHQNGMHLFVCVLCSFKTDTGGNSDMEFQFLASGVLNFFEPEGTFEILALHGG